MPGHPPSTGVLEHLPTSGTPHCVREASFTEAVGLEFPGGVKSGLCPAGYVVDGDTEEEVAADMETVVAWSDEQAVCRPTEIQEGTL
ncbi:hypothetical protein [Streptomyces sp. NBC_01727]|uniref:hypothetical protein n=1 Tax=Streptomyces sp. NBC_01727 TaxID=2975924 RepID=UPI002E1343A7|nr:hypothetical protein OIE76_32305 [Streptomyces sp. NBC_01727]